MWNGSAIWKNQAFWHVKETTNENTFVWPPSYAPDIIREFRRWVENLQKELQFMNEDQLMMPLRKLFTQNKLINGIGAYNFAEFSHILWNKLELLPWSPISLLVKNLTLFKSFCVILADYMASCMDNMRREILSCGIPSGCRPCTVMERRFCLQRLQTYRSPKANVYRVTVERHTTKLIYFRPVIENDPRVEFVHRVTNPFTERTLAVGPYSWQGGGGKDRMAAVPGYEPHLGPKAIIEEWAAKKGKEKEEQTPKATKKVRKRKNRRQRTARQREDGDYRVKKAAEFDRRMQLPEDQHHPSKILCYPDRDQLPSTEQWMQVPAARLEEMDNKARRMKERGRQIYITQQETQPKTQKKQGKKRKRNKPNREKSTKKHPKKKGKGK